MRASQTGIQPVQTQARLRCLHPDLGWLDRPRLDGKAIAIDASRIATCIAVKKAVTIW
ncbi:hypothetical protein GS610_15245 [Ruegeria sp. HKCCD6228]|uniref:hypothetical protein n=1 Tax=Ruegeria sp. HKCCA5463 TaxID=2682994 RepID=UPI001561EF94|nr:hypothetical protein [Ruegeria sp. HKCCA5463]NOC84790.1 hypothetical protein [Ruegeria sp. HKCCD6428]NOD98560.1 hypothetical protein [Ruegeria sp. HKCCD6228]